MFCDSVVFDDIRLAAERSQFQNLLYYDRYNV